jgi:hypothetical protein
MPSTLSTGIGVGVLEHGKSADERPSYGCGTNGKDIAYTIPSRCCKQHTNRTSPKRGLAQTVGEVDP